MYNESSESIKAGLIYLVISFAMLFGSILTTWTVLTDKVDERSAAESVVIGEVSNKKVAPAIQGLFAYHDAVYNLYLDVEYEYDGESKTTTRRISVDKETYQAAEIGDSFNIHTLEVIPAVNSAGDSY